MIGVDVGGTFTDVVAIVDGEIRVTKVPSIPDDPQQSVIEGARRLGVEGSTVFNHASTKGLNAVLTRNLPKIGFITTDGHRDMLDGGRAWRPFNAQMDPNWRRSFGDVSRPLVPRYLRRGVQERILASGEVLIPLNEADARAHLELLKHCNVEGVAICLLNAYTNPAHEQQLKALAQEILGNVPITISSEASPRSKEFSRAMTTVIDVMMKGIYGEYAHKLHAGLSDLGYDGALNFADCTASLLPWRDALEYPYRIIFAGPAAGAASCVRLGEAIGEENLICCDVGGTSTDVALIMEGAPFTNDMFELEYDLVINALSTEVSSVGAGGGSIISVSPSGDIQAGPASAGAYPGPACYCRDGEKPTVTDACLLMGILPSDEFAEGQLQLDRQKAIDAFMSLDTPLPLGDRVSFAWRIAINNIAEEVANVSIRHGADPRDFSLVAYGAAGPMLLAGLLDLLSLKQVIVPPHPGLFSALGLLSTDLVYTESRSAYKVLMPGMAGEINEIFTAMEAELMASVDAKDVEIKRSFDGRILGQSWETPFIEMPNGDIDDEVVATMIHNFHTEYQRRNGQSFPRMPVQGVSYRVQVVVKADKFEFSYTEPEESEPTVIGQRELHYFSDEPVMANIYDRLLLKPGQQVSGPAVIQEALSTTLVLPGQEARIGGFGEILISINTGKGGQQHG